ncbi:MAG: electron transfer flavoprotein subunit alpha/FixB family protein, partial [Gammaproteobacteria bacterium]|nr:electron transfer flavoprotein subunit alpha/FixB family protein [Gammaproteobacteria bacterium]
MSILVLVEHNNQTINPATLNTITAAKQIIKHQAIGAEITALVIGKNISTITEQTAKIDGVHQVIGMDNSLFANQSAEMVAPIIADLSNSYTHILGNATTYGKNILPRVAARLDVMQISDISAVIDSDTFERPMYAGNVIATVASTDEKKVITVRPTKFPPTATTGGNAEIKILNSDTDSLSQLSQLSTLSQVIGTAIASTDKVSLSTAKIVIAGGRGLGSTENYQTLLVPLAEKLNAALGASRAAVDLGFCPNDYQIGQTGKVIAPDLYIAIGISGAI